MKLIKKYLFLFILLIASIVYGSANIISNENILYISKFFLVPSLAAYYLINTKKINFIYLVALSFAFIGDLLFSATFNFSTILATGCFIIFNLLILIIVFEFFGTINTARIATIASVIIIILSLLIYVLFKDIGSKLSMLIMYFAVFGILFSFCINYYLKHRSKESLYFLIGVALFFFANLSKAFEQFENIGFIFKAINIGSYSLSQYLYCKAIFVYNKENILEKQTHN